MSKSLEDSLFEAVSNGDCEGVSDLLDQGADPNRNTSHGKTCLGEAANMGHIKVLKQLIDTIISKRNYRKVLPNISSTRKLHLRSHKRKLKYDGKDGETVVKCNSLNDRVVKDSVGPSETVPQRDVDNSEKNQGYFVFVHSEGSSSDGRRVLSTKSPLSPLALTPSPQRELEWDDEIGTFAPTTSEDETWSSLYEWYAAILESSGSALASAAMVSSGIDQKDAFFRSALHYASEQGHIRAAKFLLHAGCKVDIVGGDGLTPLHVAVVNNRSGIVKTLLTAGSNINFKTHDKMTPLHFAASNGFLNMVKLLVSKGAYLEARDNSERTPLYIAASKGHYNIIRCLFVAGANVNCEDGHGYTPLCEAVWQKYPAVVEALLMADARITHCHKLLHNAIMQRQVEIVSMLAGYIGKNLHNDNGDTPLLLAARTAQPNLARILLEKGADVNSINSLAGATALHVGVENRPDKFEELLICLLEYNININTVALTGDTALYRALILEKDDAAAMLIRHGADVNISDSRYGCDNLTLARQRPSPGLVSMLLNAGYKLPAADPEEEPPPPGTTAHWLYHASRRPLTLAELCRLQIRLAFRDRVLIQCIRSLPLPLLIQRFIMMEDEG